MNDARILRKIQNGEYDDEVDEYIYRSLNWYKKHAKDLLSKQDLDDLDKIISISDNTLNADDAVKELFSLQTGRAFEVPKLE